MAKQTIAALFDDNREAQAAIRELKGAGIPSGNISIVARGPEHPLGENRHPGAAHGFLGRLLQFGILRPHADIYDEAVRRGGTLIAVRVVSGERDRVADILDSHSPVDIDTRAASWRESGWSAFGADSAAQSTTLSGAAADHGVSLGELPGTPMPTGSGTFASRCEDGWEIRREADIAAGREPDVARPARIHAYPLPDV